MIKFLIESWSVEYWWWKGKRGLMLDYYRGKMKFRMNLDEDRDDRKEMFLCNVLEMVVVC